MVIAKRQEVATKRNYAKPRKIMTQSKVKYSPTHKFSHFGEVKRRSCTWLILKKPLNSPIHHLKAFRYCGDVACIKKYIKYNKRIFFNQ